MQIEYSRIVDLTLPLVPGEGNRPLEIERGRTEELTVHVPVDHPWYVMHRVRTISHIGTHIEAPYHCFPEGRDLGRIPVEQLIGPAVVLDLRTQPPDALVGAAEMATIADAAGGVQSGDIVFLRTGYADKRDTEAFEHRPSLTRESMEYLVAAGAKLVGTDLSGLEGPRTPGHLDCHLALLGADIPFIENVGYLDRLTRNRVFVCALPVPIMGIDSFPCRIVAFE